MADTDTKDEGLGELAKEIDSAVEAATSRLAAAREGKADDAEGVDEDLRDETRPAGESDAEDGDEKRPDSSGDGSDADAGQGRDEHGRFTKKADKESAAGGQLTEGTIERAVRLGIPLAEAKQFPSEALLSATCARIEGPKGEKGKEAGSQGGAGAKGGEEDPADLLSQIPDLDPAEFDERLVGTVKALKGIVKRQQDTIAELRGKQSSDWLGAKLEGVKDLTKGDQSKTTAVREKFDVLKAGYKAAKKAVPDDVVFDEAAKMVLGGDMDALRAQKKTEAAQKRSGQRIQRPTQRRLEAKPENVSAEVADMIDRKYFS